MIDKFKCPKCGWPLRQIDHRPGKEAFVCPIALRGYMEGKSGAGWKHDAAWVYERKLETRRKD